MAEQKQSKGEDKTVCPHCHQPMKKWRTPDFSTWSASYFYVCFNDECPYFVRGWEHMEKTVQQKMSYRHHYDPSRDFSGPLPVYSKHALKGDILED